MSRRSGALIDATRAGWQGARVALVPPPFAAAGIKDLTLVEGEPPSMSIKHLVRKCLWRAGWDIKRFDPRPSEAAQLVRQLVVHQVDVLFDVGANTGQFAEMLRGAGFRGRIVSFEPSTAAHSALSKRARRDANWIIAPRMALGDHDGTITLNLADNSVSSSVLPMLPSHVRAAPESRYIGSETVDLRTLDSVRTELA